MVLTAPRLPRARTDEDEGLVAVITALVVVLVVMPLLALVVDVGLRRTAGGQARVAADAAALAAAALHPDAGGVAPAVEAAHRLASDDFGVTDEQWASCVDEHPLPAGTAPSAGNCVSFDLAAKQVRVTLPERSVPSVFAGVIGSTAPAASATSVASWGAFTEPCTLCVTGAYVGGAQQLEVHGGDVAVGGDLTVGAGAALTTDPGRAVTYGGRLTSGGRLTTTPIRGGVPTDPFAGHLAALGALASTSVVALPSPPGASAGLPCTAGTYQDVSDCRSFLPGVYVLTGFALPAPFRSTVTLRGGGTGVVFYVTCTTPWAFQPRPAPCSSGTTLQPRISFAAGTSGVTLGGNPAFGGLVLAFDPSPGSSNTNQRFTGTGVLTLRGNVDGPRVVLRNPTSPSEGRVDVAGGRVVVGGVTYDGVVPVPAHPYLTVQAPAAEPLADGPVRLVPSS